MNAPVAIAVVAGIVLVSAGACILVGRLLRRATRFIERDFAASDRAGDAWMR